MVPTRYSNKDLVFLKSPMLPSLWISPDIILHDLTSTLDSNCSQPIAQKIENEILCDGRQDFGVENLSTKAIVLARRASF